MSSDLPKGWKVEKLGDVCSSPQYGYTTSGAKTGDVKLLRTTDITSGNIHWGNVPYCLENPKDIDKYLLHDGDIVISRAGSVGVSYLLRKPDRSVFASYLIRFKPKEEIISLKYFSYFLKGPTYWNYISEKSLGIAIPNVNASKLKEIDVPFPSLPEQHRIVAKIEELFSDLDKGIESLKTAQLQLKTYRQAVLKYAFEGKFTNEWRKNRSKRLSSEELLNQISNERIDSGKVNKINIKPIPCISKDEMDELSQLPDGMAWIRLGEILWSVKDGPHYSPKYQEEGIPFISGGNIRPGGIDFKKAKFISKELHEELSRRCKPEKWDVLYSKGGTTGIARVNNYDIDFNVWVHVAVLKAIPSVNPFYLQHALNSMHCYRQSQKYTHGVGNQDLGLTRMILITLTICSLEEQCKIVEEIEDRLSVCDKVEETIETSLLQSESLRQSILKKAFEGKLV